MPKLMEETVCIKPSVELIADEYNCVKNGNKQEILVHIFSTTDDEAKTKVEVFKRVLDKSFIVTEHNLNTVIWEAAVQQILKDCKEAGGIILFFAGQSSEEGKIHMKREKKQMELFEIWQEFYSNKCKDLEKKPKIFIFEITVIKDVETDSIRLLSETPYNPPNEADIFVLYHRSRGDAKDDYIENLCENIQQYGKSDDITTLATCVSRPLHLPILISTLTRKFYFTVSDCRGYSHNIIDKKSLVFEEINTIKNLMNQGERKVKSKNSFVKRIMSSFRVKRDNRSGSQM